MHVQEVVTLRDMLLSFEDPAPCQTPRGALHQDRLADHHRVRLPRPPQRGRPQAPRTRQPGRPRRPRALHARVHRRRLRESHRLWPILAARGASSPRPPALHRDVLRQPSPQRRGGQETCHQRRARRPECDDALCAWLEEEVCTEHHGGSHHSRDVPQDIADLKERTGIDDAWPVWLAPYKHWVIEDDFVDGQRPAWERVGALSCPTCDRTSS